MPMEQPLQTSNWFRFQDHITRIILWEEDNDRGFVTHEESIKVDTDNAHPVRFLGHYSMTGQDALNDFNTRVARIRNLAREVTEKGGTS